jgi:hypothetical protein
MSGYVMLLLVYGWRKNIIILFRTLHNISNASQISYASAQYRCIFEDAIEILGDLKKKPPAIL